MESKPMKRSQARALAKKVLEIGQTVSSGSRLPLKPTLGEHRRWSQNGHNNLAIPTS